MQPLAFRQIHLDFHTSEKIGDIGTNFDKTQFQDMLKLGHVNSITVFSKCHHGWAYHPSTANEIHPELEFDLLKAQIDAAHEIGVRTPVYLSAGLDQKKSHDYTQNGYSVTKMSPLLGQVTLTNPTITSFVLTHHTLTYC